MSNIFDEMGRPLAPNQMKYASNSNQVAKEIETAKGAILNSELKLELQKLRAALICENIKPSANIFAFLSKKKDDPYQMKVKILKIIDDEDLPPKEKIQSIGRTLDEIKESNHPLNSYKHYIKKASERVDRFPIQRSPNINVPSKK